MGMGMASLLHSTPLFWKEVFLLKMKSNNSSIWTYYKTYVPLPCTIWNVYIYWTLLVRTYWFLTWRGFYTLLFKKRLSLCPNWYKIHKIQGPSVIIQLRSHKSTAWPLYEVKWVLFKTVLSYLKCYCTHAHLKFNITSQSF